jgi:anti-sigma factor RsiW
MNVTRDVVADLLPAYLAGEASADTRALVEEFAGQDAAFARALEAQRREMAAGSSALHGRMAGLPPDHELRTLARTRSTAERLRWLLAVAVMFTAFPLSFTFEGRHITFLLLRDSPILAMASWVAAAGFWIGFFSAQRKLRASGL